jgi:hypothetical protein
VGHVATGLKSLRLFKRSPILGIIAIMIMKKHKIQLYRINDPHCPQNAKNRSQTRFRRGSQGTFFDGHKISISVTKKSSFGLQNIL